MIQRTTALEPLVARSGLNGADLELVVPGGGNPSVAFLRSDAGAAMTGSELCAP